MKPQPTVLILGANGRFGVAAARAFASAGWEVVASVRRAPAQALPAGVRITQTPLADTQRLAVDSAGARLVVHAINPPYTAWGEQVMPLTRAGLDVAERLGARFLLPANVYNFGEDLPAVLREDTPQRANSRKGALRIQMEEEIQRRCDQGRVTATLVRAGDYFGGGEGNWFDALIVKGLRDGKLVYPGPRGVPHAWAYLPDLARAVVAVASRPPEKARAFERFHFAGHTLTGDELLGAIERAGRSLGIEPKRGWRRGGFPWPIVRAGGLLVPMWRELSEMAYLWRRPHALDGTALERAVGALETTPLDVAVRDAVAELGFGAAPSTGLVTSLAPSSTASS